jgi:hypothetical protein
MKYMIVGENKRDCTPCRKNVANFLVWIYTMTVQILFFGRHIFYKYQFFFITAVSVLFTGTSFWVVQCARAQSARTALQGPQQMELNVSELCPAKPTEDTDASNREKSPNVWTFPPK